MGIDFIPKLVTMLVASMVIPMLIGIALFFIKAAGVFKIAKNRGFNNAWLAFIPLANTYLLGEIADDVNARVGKRSGFKFIYLASQILIVGLSVVSYSVLTDVFGGMIISELSPDKFPMQLVSSTMALSGISGLFGIIQLVVTIMVKYRIYVDYVPQNATLYTVLSTIFDVTTPFFMLSISKKPSYSINQQMNPNWTPPQYGYQPYNGQQQPYNGQQQPYNGQQQPYNGQQQQPYNGQQQQPHNDDNSNAPQ